MQRLSNATTGQPAEREDVGAWQVRQIEAALAQAKAGGPFTPHERVAEWALLLGTKTR